MLDYFCVYLIDEPESFLHPPQAKIMGQIIGQTLTNEQQAFISTHSEEIIKGLLETCPNRIKIIRITRNGDINNFSVLDKSNFQKVWQDPLLKYSNILSGIFHKTVVLCESDSDCKMYSIIDNHLKQKQGKFSETLFIHCGGKHRMSKIIRALKALNVDIKVIPDIDILNNIAVFKELIETVDVAWNSIEKDYEILSSNLHSDKEMIKRKKAKDNINEIIVGSKEINLSSDEIKTIKEIISTSSKWEQLKKMGASAIPSGDAKNSFNKLNDILKQHNIFLVLVGELENFIKEVGGHGPEWVNQVVETYPDFDNSVYSSISNFVSELNL